MILRRNRKYEAVDHEAVDHDEMDHDEMDHDEMNEESADPARDDASDVDRETVGPSDDVSQDEAADDVLADPWSVLDVSRDWRTSGPFDITEVDLDADDVDRLDFGSVILTPFESMQLQLQMEQMTGQIQSILVLDGVSAIEMALFAAPANGSMLGEIRTEMANQTSQTGGVVEFAEGPFGTEIRRDVPVTTPQGQAARYITRTWFAQGPKWLLRGTLMGKAGLAHGVDDVSELLYEFFANTVVRRGHAPMVPGALIPLIPPPQLLAGLAAGDGVGQPQAAG